MGAGRKTFTYDCDTRNETNYRFEQQQKNLGTQLGGVIFSERLRRRRCRLGCLCWVHTGRRHACWPCRAMNATRISPIPSLPSPPSPAVCNNQTFYTCMENKMFGLPSPHWCYVQHIRAG